MTVAVLALAACAGQSPGDRSTVGEEGGARVVEVVDGDTIVVDFDDGDDDETIRLLGIDTPETHHPDRPIECFGPEATDFTTALLPAGTAVRVERDVVNRDAYDRVLGYVHRLEDDLFVNEELVRRGYAVPMSIEPNVTHHETFVSAARTAEADNAGLWAACGG